MAIYGCGEIGVAVVVVGLLLLLLWSECSNAIIITVVNFCLA